MTLSLSLSRSLSLSLERFSKAVSSLFVFSHKVDPPHPPTHPNWHTTNSSHHHPQYSHSHGVSPISLTHSFSLSEAAAELADRDMDKRAHLRREQMLGHWRTLLRAINIRMRLEEQVRSTSVDQKQTHSLSTHTSRTTSLTTRLTTSLTTSLTQFRCFPLLTRRTHSPCASPRLCLVPYPAKPPLSPGFKFCRSHVKRPLPRSPLNVDPLFGGNCGGNSTSSTAVWRAKASRLATPELGSDSSTCAVCVSCVCRV